jgi:hypothetical protein
MAAVQCLLAFRTGHTGCFSPSSSGAMDLFLHKPSNRNDLCVDTSEMFHK